MTDANIHHQITELVEQEHQLRATLAAGGTDEDRAALRQVEESLDQCWDLLRQRDARRDAGETRTRPRPGRCPRSRATCSSSATGSRNSRSQPEHRHRTPRWAVMTAARATRTKTAIDPTRRGPRPAQCRTGRGGGQDRRPGTRHRDHRRVGQGWRHRRRARRRGRDHRVRAGPGDGAARGDPHPGGGAGRRPSPGSTTAATASASPAARTSPRSGSRPGRRPLSASPAPPGAADRRRSVTQCHPSGARR